MASGPGPCGPCRNDDFAIERTRFFPLRFHVSWETPGRLPPLTSPSHLKGGEVSLIGAAPCARSLAVPRCLFLGANVAGAQDAPPRADIWSLKLGTSAAALPRDAFIDYACGSNGGPPQRPLAGWFDYDKCPPEASGLREFLPISDRAPRRGASVQSCSRSQPWAARGPAQSLTRRRRSGDDREDPGLRKLLLQVWSGRRPIAPHLP
jgi:hypothetical protein